MGTFVAFSKVLHTLQVSWHGDFCVALPRSHRSHRSEALRMVHESCFHQLIWMFPKIVVPPNHPCYINFKRIVHYKPSILGYPYLWKHPYGSLSHPLQSSSSLSSGGAGMSSFHHIEFYHPEILLSRAEKIVIPEKSIINSTIKEVLVEHICRWKCPSYDGKCIWFPFSVFG